LKIVYQSYFSFNEGIRGAPIILVWKLVLEEKGERDEA
jgi:hypothetical protein